MMNGADAENVRTDQVQSRRVRWGDTVRVDFVAWLEDGSLIDSSIYTEPLVFTAGAHSVIQGVEQLVIGMTVGESKTERIPPEKSFGPYRPELSCQVSRSWLEAQDVLPALGLGLELRKKDDTLVSMIITGLEGDRVTLDANHRLAGKIFVLQLDLLDIIEDRPTLVLDSLDRG
jgi:FKBP-type peptidyl-prolyl cis-trans isomerase 2